MNNHVSGVCVQVRCDSDGLCELSEAALRATRLRHGVLLPLQAALAPQSDVRRRTEATQSAQPAPTLQSDQRVGAQP